METLPDAIRTRRERLGISQSRAARVAGVSRTTWVNWETGATVPERFNYAKIENPLEWEPGSVEAVLGGRPPVVRRSEQGPPPELPQVTAREWARFDPVDQEMILNAIRIARARQDPELLRASRGHTPET
jgi:DNA-binding XRE family transcriptional regulator